VVEHKPSVVEVVAGPCTFAKAVVGTPSAVVDTSSAAGTASLAVVAGEAAEQPQLAAAPVAVALVEVPSDETRI